MTILEKKSLRKKKSILSLVQKGEYSAGYAMILVEELNDNGKLTDSDYEELAEYLEKLLDEETAIEETESTGETTEPEIIDEIPQENVEE